MPGFYDDLCNVFIRPTRQTYSEHDLGSVQDYQGSPFIKNKAVRQNFSFNSILGYEIKVSFYKNRQSIGNICVLYLHSFNGSRLESLRYVEDLINRGLHFCCFDFAGCGNSAGEYVSLGYNQRKDTLTLINKIYSQYGINNFFVWGRSMGAVAAIKLCSLLDLSKRENSHSYINMMGLILDSPFCSLSRLAIEVAQKRINIPEILLKAVFMMIKSTIESKADFKVEDLDILNDVTVIKCPTLLIASKDDNLIDWHHSQEIYKELRVEDRRIEYITGQHYQNRSKKVIASIYNFIDQNICKKIIHRRNNSNSKNEEILRISLDRQSKSLTREQIVAEQIQMHKFNRNIGSLNKNNSSSTNIFQNISSSFQGHLIDGNKYLASITTQKKEERIKKDQFFSEKRIKQVQSIKKTLEVKNVRCKNELRNKSKPTVTFKTFEPYSSEKNQKKEFQSAIDMSNERYEQNQIKNEVSHKNIINDKLKKKGKQNREHQIRYEVFKTSNINHEHVNKINFQNKQKKNQTNDMVQKQVNQNALRQTKKLSLITADYKHHRNQNQSSLLKPFTFLSPCTKKINEKGNNLSDNRFKGESDNLKRRDYDQSRSMNNLLIPQQEQSLVRIGGSNTKRIKNFMKIDTPIKL